MSRDVSALSQGNRKKIEQYSYCLNDRIGKGYSSVVYRGRNDESSKFILS
jgi:serine/threonine-protein kinase ULK/ATG1